MGIKSRANWPSFCVKECENRNERCNDCLKFSNYKPKKEVDNGKEG